VCVCVPVRVHVCMYVCADGKLYVLFDGYVYFNTCVDIRVCVYVCVCVCVCVCTCVCEQCMVCSIVCIRVFQAGCLMLVSFVFAAVHRGICAYVCIYTDVRTHTHTNEFNNVSESLAPNQ